MSEYFATRFVECNCYVIQYDIGTIMMSNIKIKSITTQN